MAVELRRDFLQALPRAQFGVGLECGTEIGARMAREAWANGKLVLLLDAKNAFNSVSRSSILTQVARRIPRLAAYAHAYVRLPSPLVYEGRVLEESGQPERFTLRSATGVRQGSPLSPALFAIALQDSIERLAEEHPSVEVTA